MSDSELDYAESDEEYSLSENNSEDEEEILSTFTSAHVEDARSTIVQHMDITNANALAINKKMQANLLLLKGQLEEMLHKCQQRYKDNETALMQKIQVKYDKPQTKRDTSFYFYGYPFFKNHQLLTARPNADYMHRKNYLGEYFPIEVDETPVFWVITDKVCLINGVREQVVGRLLVTFKDRQRKAIKQSESIDGDLLLTVGEYKSQLSKMPLLDLMGMIPAKDSFTINWSTISDVNLDGRHKPNAAEALWNAYLQPNLNRCKWTAEEDDLLLNAIEHCVPLDWSKVATRMDRRSVYQCVVHYRTKLALPNAVNCGRWTAEEDALLLENVEKYRIGNEIPWSNVVANIQKRNKSQVYQRYTMTLKPGISRERFTTEEDCKLMAGFKEFGSNFHKYRKLLPGRTTLQIRNRYNNVLQYVGKRANWTPEDDAILMDHVAKFGTSNWTIAALLKHHTRTSCRSRYTAITRFLKKNPGSGLENVPRRNVRMSSEVTSDNWVEKIIEAKQASFNQRKILSEQNRKFYNYFKYSFSYQFQIDQSAPTPTTDKTMAMCRALNCRMCPLDDLLLTALPAATINLKHLDDMEMSGDTALPVDRNTAILLRGLSIMFPDDLTSSEREEVKTPISHPAIDLFRRRFVTLLKNTADWSQFVPNTNANIKVTIEVNPQMKVPLKEIKVYSRKMRETPSLPAGTLENDNLIVSHEIESEISEPPMCTDMFVAKVETITNNDIFSTIESDSMPEPLKGVTSKCRKKNVFAGFSTIDVSMSATAIDSRITDSPKGKMSKNVKIVSANTSTNDQIHVKSETLTTPMKRQKGSNLTEQASTSKTDALPDDFPSITIKFTGKMEPNSQVELPDDSFAFDNMNVVTETAPKQPNTPMGIRRKRKTANQTETLNKTKRL